MVQGHCVVNMSGKVSIDELSKHNNPDDLWTVVNGKVYDLSKFAPEHPGGPDGMYQNPQK